MNEDIQHLPLSEFPALLREITDPPKQLYVRGEVPPDDMKFLCVVGSRRYTSYGKNACEKLISGLQGHNIVVVSGLALGTDAIAHKAALDAGITSMAVPGSGLDWKVLHPKTNHPLARRILESGGSIVSEYEPDFAATLWSFPKRNRIMVGLSHAVLLIEAAEKSGTLITAKLTAEYNRDLLAVPGSIFSANSKGTHQFIRLGATPVTTSEDILEALHVETNGEQSQINLDSLSPAEKKIIGILHEPMPRDELIRALRLPTHEANTLLSAMELKGIIIEKMGEVRIK